jgi:hypothetical protein
VIVFVAFLGATCAGGALQCAIAFGMTKGARFRDVIGGYPFAVAMVGLGMVLGALPLIVAPSWLKARFTDLRVTITYATTSGLIYAWLWVWVIAQKPNSNHLSLEVVEQTFLWAPIGAIAGAAFNLIAVRRAKTSTIKIFPRKIE